MSTITLNTWVTFNVAEMLVFNESAVEKDYEYEIVVPGSLSNFFSQAKYKQVGDSNDEYVVDTVTLGTGAEIAGESASLTTGSLNPAGTGIVGGSTLTVGQRVVEILALKLFGHARAKAAIANDTAIEATQWKSPLEAVFHADRNLIFEQYVGLDRVEPVSNDSGLYNDTDAWQNFNFSGLSFVVPVHLSLDSMDDDDHSGSLTSAAKTGPVYGSTTQLVDGQLSNCPVKLTITIA